MISRSCLDTLMERQFLFFTRGFPLLTVPVVFPARATLNLNNWELLIVKLALSAGTSYLLNCY